VRCLQQDAVLYGGLYLWDEALDYTDKEKGRGICPPGWHLPSEQEWQELEIEIGMDPDDLNKNGYERGEGSDPSSRKKACRVLKPAYGTGF
jgi:uncharacterized protein (TIGR02145 family)